MVKITNWTVSNKARTVFMFYYALEYHQDKRGGNFLHKLSVVTDLLANYREFLEEVGLKEVCQLRIIPILQMGED